MKFFSLVFICVGLSFSVAQAELSGYSTLQTIIQGPINSNSFHKLGMWNLANVNRLNYSQQFGAFRMEIAQEILQLYQSTFDPSLRTNWKNQRVGFRIDDFNPVVVSEHISENRDYYLLHNLDRFFISTHWKEIDFLLGRQPIALGSSKLIAPTDIFAPLPIVTLNTQERTGSDALRIRKALGALGELDFAYIAGEEADFRQSAFYLRFVQNISNVELSTLAGSFYQAWALGLDILVSAYGSNIYWETLFLGPRGEDTFARSSLGVERQLSENIFATLEYHHNSAGLSKGEDFTSASQFFLYKHSVTSLIGKHYLSGLFTYQVHPLHGLGLNFYVNVEQGSPLIFPTWNYSLSDNSSFQLSGFLGSGKEFKNYGSSIHSMYICYF